ncbi:hypothetical protein L1987_15675 [Smallanthus sonchifolius]|uniref:Uncharacterized protein n=1 Tax=Smallanthus sonchifolius TaxID=185202 RepID=A0ACB9J784_9ASTR|nr:hypothetical protein L1987_15675 [Smallanthus sonchifolius]
MTWLEKLGKPAKWIRGSRRHESLHLPWAANGEVLESLMIKNPRETKDPPAEEKETGKLYKEGAASGDGPGIEMNSIAPRKIGLTYLPSIHVDSPMHKKGGRKIVPKREGHCMVKKWDKEVSSKTCTMERKTVPKDEKAVNPQCPSSKKIRRVTQLLGYPEPFEKGARCVLYCFFPFLLLFCFVSLWLFSTYIMKA